MSQNAVSHAINSRQAQTLWLTGTKAMELLEGGVFKAGASGASGQSGHSNAFVGIQFLWKPWLCCKKQII